MSREVRRVPLDFDFPRGKTWTGYLMPDLLGGQPCEPCGGSGYSPTARHLHARWYGKVPFDPSETGATRLTPDTSAVRAFAERNVSHAPDFYAAFHGVPADRERFAVGAHAVEREAERLCTLWNGMWSHHLHQDDVDALLAADRLWDLTRTWADGVGWQLVEPPPVVTAAQVNLWSLGGFGHDSINASVVVRAACERQGQPVCCEHCDGHGRIERYPGQRADAEAWEPTDPPTGDGYQLWQTVSEGGPVSPVFATPSELADWILTEGTQFDGRDTPRAELVAWVERDGVSVGTGVVGPGGSMSGVAFAAAGRRSDA